MFEIKDIFTPQKKVDKEDVLVNVRNAVDAYENGFYKSASFMD